MAICYNPFKEKKIIYRSVLTWDKKVVNSAKVSEYLLGFSMKISRLDW